MKSNLTHEMERIVLDKETVDQLEKQILFERHIERYALIRQYLFGKVIDIACGVGYGSYLMAKNPDVEEIMGVDIDHSSIQWAQENFSSEKIRFQCNSIEEYIGEHDFLVSLETIEHLEQPEVLRDLALRTGVKEIIVSFPHKKTTHYNQFHRWDLRREDIIDIFEDFECINTIYNHDSTIMHLIKRERRGVAPVRYGK